jgi:hypothetical protein
MAWKRRRQRQAKRRPRRRNGRLSGSFSTARSRVRLDRKVTSISVLVALGVREAGQKVMLAVKNMAAKARQPGERSSTILSNAA